MERAPSGASREARVVNKRALLTFIVTGLMLAAPAAEARSGGWARMKRSPHQHTETQKIPELKDDNYNGGWAPMTRHEAPPKQDTPLAPPTVKEQSPLPPTSRVEEGSREAGGEKKEQAYEDLSTVKISAFEAQHRGINDGWAVEISPETMRQILAETFPRGWVKGEIREIRQVDTVHKITYLPDATQGTVVKNEAIATCSTEKEGPNEIVFYSPSYKATLRTLVEVLYHEAGHANDWDKDNSLSPEARKILEDRIGERVQSPDRLQTAYVEAIPADNFEHRKQEYWAEICEQYLRNAELLNIDDFTLVDQVVKLTDPNFDWRDAAARREALIAKADSPLPKK